ncbi:hypothetical protein Csa_005105 [Cucumis sativus]|uniref:Fungal lipase-type domain-containing protein n=1 Tax=Cucumis sativus TaxID=3659 RepID=A0A0A0KDT6_CUCSA|nr:hypothetical protein Csa_005105 [Cucumis sativus]
MLHLQTENCRRMKAMHSVICHRNNTLKKNKDVGHKWTEYQGIQNWDGLLDPLDHHLRTEILRYGRFVEAAYDSFQYNPTSPFYASCRHSKSSLLNRTGLSKTGYRVTKYLRATSSLELPYWVEKAANSTATRSSWIGYVAVCEDKKEIARLGRRDIVFAYRGTATCLEWLENLRFALTELSDSCSSWVGSKPMVETGYTGEPLSLTITGHSLGAALAILTAYDIKMTFEQRAPPVTVVSFGGPRVGNKDFQRSLDEQGTKVLRIVNSDDIVTKVPGIVVDDDNLEALPWWIRQCVENVQSQRLYSEVGKELKVNNKSTSWYVNGGIMNMGMHHDLKTYLHLVEAS